MKRGHQGERDDPRIGPAPWRPGVAPRRGDGSGQPRGSRPASRSMTASGVTSPTTRPLPSVTANGVLAAMISAAKLATFAVAAIRPVADRPLAGPIRPPAEITLAR